MKTCAQKQNDNKYTAAKEEEKKTTTKPNILFTLIRPLEIDRCHKLYLMQLAWHPTKYKTQNEITTRIASIIFYTVFYNGLSVCGQRFFSFSSSSCVLPFQTFATNLRIETVSSQHTAREKKAFNGNLLVFVYRFTSH